MLDEDADEAELEQKRREVLEKQSGGAAAAGAAGAAGEEESQVSHGLQLHSPWRTIPMESPYCSCRLTAESARPT